MGGIHPEVIFGATLVCLGVALVGGTAALVLSVFCTKTYEGLLVCYLLVVFSSCCCFRYPSLLPSTIPTNWAKFSNPFYLLFLHTLYESGVGGNRRFRLLLGCRMHWLFGFTHTCRCHWLGCRVIVRHGSVNTKKVTRRRWWQWQRFLKRSWLPGPDLHWMETPSSGANGIGDNRRAGFALCGGCMRLGALGFSVYGFPVRRFV